MPHSYYNVKRRLHINFIGNLSFLILLKDFIKARKQKRLNSVFPYTNYGQKKEGYEKKGWDKKRSSKIKLGSCWFKIKEIKLVFDLFSCGFCIVFNFIFGNP